MAYGKDWVVSFLSQASALMDENKEYLIDLDANLGDGDLGLTMSTGFRKALEFAPTCTETDLGKMLMRVGMVIAQAVPSTMGTLVASGFMKAGKVLTGKTEFEAPEFAVFAEGFAAGIMERGKAQPGQRTIVDALHPAAEALRGSLAAGAPLAQAVEAAHAAALGGVEATKQMPPCFGRAVYYAEKALGIPDQGAVVGGLIYEAMAKSL